MSDFSNRCSSYRAFIRDIRRFTSVVNIVGQIHYGVWVSNTIWTVKWCLRYIIALMTSFGWAKICHISWKCDVNWISIHKHLHTRVSWTISIFFPWNRVQKVLKILVLLYHENEKPDFFLLEPRESLMCSDVMYWQCCAGDEILSAKHCVWASVSSTGHNISPTKGKKSAKPWLEIQLQGTLCHPAQHPLMPEQLNCVSPIKWN